MVNGSFTEVDPKSDNNHNLENYFEYQEALSQFISIAQEDIKKIKSKIKSLEKNDKMANSLEKVLKKLNQNFENIKAQTVNSIDLLREIDQPVTQLFNSAGEHIGVIKDIELIKNKIKIFKNSEEKYRVQLDKLTHLKKSYQGFDFNQDLNQNIFVLQNELNSTSEEIKRLEDSLLENENTINLIKKEYWSKESTRDYDLFKTKL